MNRLGWLATLSLALGACGGGAPPEAGGIFDDAVKNIVVEVDYGRGAAPFAGYVPGFGDLWDVFGSNARSLFQGTTKTFEIPTRLEEMQELDDVGGADFSQQQILAIADAHRDREPSSDTATFYVLFLDGYLNEGGARQTSVLGASLGQTGVIAIFEPVIASADGSDEHGTSRFVEQATLVHELGHAVGLVNNGIPATSEHQDTDHGAHCSSPDCVMFWQNEGDPAQAVRFAARVLTTSDTTLFGDECLADAAAAVRAVR